MQTQKTGDFPRFFLILRSDVRLEFHRKGVLAVFAFRPQLTLVLGDDAFGDGQTQTEAAVPAAGFIHAVKPLEDLLQLLHRRWSISARYPAGYPPPAEGPADFPGL